MVVGLHQLQPGHVHIQIHLLLDSLVARAQRLDLRIRQRRLVHVVARADGAFARHDLRDELLLVFKRLKQIGVECAVGHIVVDLHLPVQVALPDDAPIALRHVRRTPTDVQMMHGDKQPLHVGPGAHLRRAAQQHAHLTGTNLGKQFLLFSLGIRMMDERDFALRHARADQLRADVVIDVERPVALRRAHVAKDELRQLLLPALLPDSQHVAHAGVQLAAGIVRQQGIHQALIQADLPAVRRDGEHVVHGRVNRTGVNGGGALGQRFHHFLLKLGRLRHDGFKPRLRDREVQLVAGLHVRDLLEQIHQLRQIEELGEPGSRPVARALRSQLNSRRRLSEGGRPLVKMRQSLLPKRFVLQIALHGVQLCHRVAHGRARGKDHALAACQLVHVPTLGEHVARLLRLARGQARNVAHFGI